jgi:hypothetical protein
MDRRSGATLAGFEGDPVTLGNKVPYLCNRGHKSVQIDRRFAPLLIVFKGFTVTIMNGKELAAHLPKWLTVNAQLF